MISAKKHYISETQKAITFQNLSFVMPIISYTMHALLDNALLFSYWYVIQVGLQFSLQTNLDDISILNGSQRCRDKQNL